MTASIAPCARWPWRCLHCGSALEPEGGGLECSGCGRRYPVIAGIPILVKDPVGYLRSELASLTRAAHGARNRQELFNRVGPDADLPGPSLDRHRDVNNAEIARAETFLALLKPAAEALSGSRELSLGAAPSGWTFDSLLPYLLRDWTNTSELAALSARIDAALKHEFPDPSGKSVIFAACGAGGLLAEISPDFDHILGFDLTLPILAAARHLLDGKSLNLALPQAISIAGEMTLCRRAHGAAGPHRDLAAMDVFDTAFADGSVDCVVTSFLIDLLPEPLNLASEIHRILRPEGIWINYGPSGPLKALWRFDELEGAALIESAGFTVVGTKSYRTTYLDISRECPAWSFQSHICYLTSARKTGPGKEKPTATMPSLTELPDLIPQHLPGATLIQRQSLEADQKRTTLIRHEALPRRAKNVEISNDTARAMTLVDGTRTIREIATLLQQQEPSRPVDETIRAFESYFRQGLLRWRVE